MRRNQRGFTLMELMVVIVIVAILAAVAVPLYINYVKDARRTEAKGAIAALISAAQVYYQRREPTTTYVGLYSSADSIHVGEITRDVARNWVFTITNEGVNTFTITAIGQADANGLTVKYEYDRANPLTPSKWTES